MDSTPEILLIEDNADDRDLFASALLASGLDARVTFAGDAAQAVLRLNRMGEFAQTPLPTLVVLDLGLPGLQGKTLLQVIRNAYGPRTIPVVILTGSYRSVDRTECEAWGICEYFIKPRTYLEQIRLVASLRRWLIPTTDRHTPSTEPTSGSHPLFRASPTGRKLPSDAHRKTPEPHLAPQGTDALVRHPASEPQSQNRSATMDFSLLIIEDNEDDVFLLTDALDRDGVFCRREWHRSGEAGLAALRDAGRREPLPGLIICDLDMPGMSGHAVLENLRRDERLRTIPVMILTGSTSFDDRVYGAAADHYFIKPKTRFEWQVITRLVKRHATRPHQPIMDAMARPIGSVGPPLILHVEDDADDRELFRIAFEQSAVAGRLHQVASAEDAQRFLQVQPLPALVVLDLALPGSSGRDLLQDMRAQETLQHLPVVVMSGSDNFADIQACRDLYIIDYVVKPTNERQMSEFISTLQHWFNSALAQSVVRTR